MMRAPIATSGTGGEVAEWSNVPDSKSGVGLRPPWVRIPPSPPTFLKLRSRLMPASCVLGLQTSASGLRLVVRQDFPHHP